MTKTVSTKIFSLVAALAVFTPIAFAVMDRAAQILA